jgi:nuclear cap-binding protein subunit 1
VTLLLALSRRPAPAENTEEVEVDAQVGDKRKAEGEEEVLEDLSRAFRGWVEGREWLNMRLAVCAASTLRHSLSGWKTPR